MGVVRRLLLFLCIVTVCASCTLFPTRVPPGQRAVRQLVQAERSQDGLYEIVHEWVLELVDPDRYPGRLPEGAPPGPSLQYDSPAKGRIVARPQIWVDYPSGRHRTEFTLTVQVQDGRVRLSAEEPRYWRTGKVSRYTLPGLWLRSAVDTEGGMDAFRSAVLEAFRSLEAAIRTGKGP